eukprot:scaffold6362_cov378-Prasinococcus_capsulatus_cf.AAC.17
MAQLAHIRPPPCTVQAAAAARAADEERTLAAAHLSIHRAEWEHKHEQDLAAVHAKMKAALDNAREEGTRRLEETTTALAAAHEHALEQPLAALWLRDYSSCLGQAKADADAQRWEAVKALNNEHEVKLERLRQEHLVRLEEFRLARDDEAAVAEAAALADKKAAVETAEMAAASALAESQEAQVRALDATNRTLMHVLTVSMPPRLSIAGCVPRVLE